MAAPGEALGTCETADAIGIPPPAGDRPTRPGSAASPCSSGRLIVSATSRASIPADRQLRPGALRFGSSKGRRGSPRSTRQRSSQNPVPSRSQSRATSARDDPAADHRQEARREDEEQQQVEVAEAPRPAELTRRSRCSGAASTAARSAGRARGRRPWVGFSGRRAGPRRRGVSGRLDRPRSGLLRGHRTGQQRAPQGRGRDQPEAKGIGSPAIWLRAFRAARCSASFLFRPQAGGNELRPTCAAILKHLEWSGPCSSSSR